MMDMEITDAPFPHPIWLVLWCPVWGGVDLNKNKADLSFLYKFRVWIAVLHLSDAFYCPSSIVATYTHKPRQLPYFLPLTIFFLSRVVAGFPLLS